MRKGSLIPDGLISRAVREGILLRKQLIADGNSEAEADRIVGQGLKAAWETSTKREADTETHGIYRCPKCFDSGWNVVKPTYVEQKRITRMYGENPTHQDYMEACDPCAWRDNERQKRRELTGQDEGFAAAGRTRRITGRKFA